MISRLEMVVVWSMEGKMEDEECVLVWKWRRGLHSSYETDSIPIRIDRKFGKNFDGDSPRLCTH